MPGEGWSRRQLAVVLVGLLLVSAFAGANVAVAAERTVLSADHVVETMDDRGAFAELTETFRDEVSTEVSVGTAELNLPAGIELVGFGPDDVATKTVSESHVRSETVVNIEQLYVFLYGDVDEIAMTFDLQPVKSAIADGISESVVIDTPVLVGDASDDIETERIAALEEDEESFSDAQLDLPEAEVEELRTEIRSETEAAGHPEALTDALVTLQLTVVDGLTGALTFEAYTAQLEQAESDVKAALGVAAVAGIEDTLVLDAESEALEQSLREVQTPVQLASTLAWVLAGAALVLVGTVQALTDSRSRTVATAGAAVLCASGLSVVVSLVMRQQAPALFSGGASGTAPLLEGFRAAVENMATALVTQAAVLALVGAACVALVVASDRGAFGQFDRATVDGTPEPSSTESASADSDPSEGHSERP